MLAQIQFMLAKIREIGTDYNSYVGKEYIDVGTEYSTGANVGMDIVHILIGNIGSAILGDRIIPWK